MRLTIFIILLLSVAAKAQQPVNYYQVDSASFALYNKADAKGLRKIVKQANDAGIDFYYLRMRAGIVHYNKGNFEEAATHFKKALQYFPIDTLAAEYLYFSYTNSGNVFEANLTAPKLNQSQRIRYGIKLKAVQSVSIGGGYAFSNNQKQNGTMNLMGQSQLGFADAMMLDNTAFGQLGMVNNISPRVKLITGYAYFNLTNTHRMQSVVANQNVLLDTAGGYTTTQHDAYVSPVLYLGKGFYVSPALHFINYSFKTYTRSFYPPPPQPGQINVNQNLYFGGIEVGARFKYVNFSLSGGISGFDTLALYHGNAGLAYYPLGNNNLYGITNLLMLSNDSVSFAFTQRIGVKLFKGVWFEAGFAKGQLRYFSENNGYTIYTTPDQIRMRLSGVFNIYLSKKFSLSLGYIFLRRTGEFIRSLNPANYVRHPLDYNNHLITTTLTITP